MSNLCYASCFPFVPAGDTRPVQIYTFKVPHDILNYAFSIQGPNFGGMQRGAPALFIGVPSYEKVLLSLLKGSAQEFRELSHMVAAFPRLAPSALANIPAVGFLPAVLACAVVVVRSLHYSGRAAS